MDGHRLTYALVDETHGCDLGHLRRITTMEALNPEALARFYGHWDNGDAIARCDKCWQVWVTLDFEVRTEIMAAYEQIAPRILTVLAGSHAHGINTEASDFDYLSVIPAPLSTTLGINPPVKTVVKRDAPVGTRSSAGDVEHTIYELRHYLQLAAQGNPNILVPLFCADEHIVRSTPRGRQLRELARDIVSMQAVRRHLGYLDAQYGRMKGEGPHQSRKPNRPELVEAHGYDTKYAAHALRLGWQGIELALRGRLALPLEGQAREFLLAVRAGEVSEAEVSEQIKRARVTLVACVERTVPSPLAERPNYDKINNWLIEVQLEAGRNHSA